MASHTREEIRQILFETITAIAPEVDPAALAPDKPLRPQVDLDSFDFLNVIIRLHERLGVDIPESDYGQLMTIEATVDYLARRVAAAA
jgi:acyl carrier protein